MIFHAHIDHILFTYPLMSSWVASKNNVAMNMAVQISLRSCFQFFWLYTQTVIAGSYSNSIFNFLRNCHIVFHSNCSILHFHQYFLANSCFCFRSSHLNGCEVGYVFYILVFCILGYDIYYRGLYLALNICHHYALLRKKR